MNIETINSISSLKIDVEKIYQLQEQFGPLLRQIDIQKKPDDEQAKKESLARLIEDRMYKYAFRLAEEYKLKKEEDIKKMFYETIQGIFDYSWSLVEKKGEITQEDINTLHKKLYPKGLWGTTIGPKGQKFKKLYPAGEYRQERDFRRNKDGQEYDYVDFNNIPELTDIINDFFYDKTYAIHFLVKAILYFLYITGVHPFYNGNGTVYIILLSVLLLKNGYDIPEDLQEYNKMCSDSNIFINARHNLDYEPLIRGFLELFEKDETTQKNT